MSNVEAEVKAYVKILEGLEELSKHDQSRKYLIRVGKAVGGKRSLEALIDSYREFADKAGKWCGHKDLASILAYQLYVKAKAYLDQNDAKNAHKFYDLTMKALKLSQQALERSDLEEFEKRLRRLEMQSGEA